MRLSLAARFEEVVLSVLFGRTLGKKEVGVGEMWKLGRRGLRRLNRQVA